MLAYAILMLWFSQLYARRIFYAAGFIAMGVALEFIQGMTPYRTFEYFDMAANAAGVLLGWALALITRKIVPR